VLLPPGNCYREEKDPFSTLTGRDVSKLVDVDAVLPGGETAQVDDHQDV
jgi:hypothetical protein